MLAVVNAVCDGVLVVFEQGKVRYANEEHDEEAEQGKEDGWYNGDMRHARERIYLRR
jgi:hypothetical protein